MGQVNWNLVSASIGAILLLSASIAYIVDLKATTITYEEHKKLEEKVYQNSYEIGIIKQQQKEYDEMLRNLDICYYQLYYCAQHIPKEDHVPPEAMPKGGLGG